MIDHEGRAPLYVQVAEVIAARIAAGEYLEDRVIPSELHLRQEFDVSRDTIRRAVRLLALRGLVVTVNGKGTYVLPSGS